MSGGCFVVWAMRPEQSLCVNAAFRKISRDVLGRPGRAYQTPLFIAHVGPAAAVLLPGVSQLIVGICDSGPAL